MIIIKLTPANILECDNVIPFEQKSPLGPDEIQEAYFIPSAMKFCSCVPNMNESIVQLS